MYVHGYVHTHLGTWVLTPAVLADRIAYDAFLNTLAHSSNSYKDVNAVIVGANPTIVSYNATSSLVRLERKIFSSTLKKRSQIYNATNNIARFKNKKDCFLL
jgi:hypothetical protein